MYVQNPSIVLAAWVCLLRGVLGYRVVMDRHSNFYTETRGVFSLKWWGYHVLSRYGNSRADLTIVTNDALKAVVQDDGGRGYVLQDLLPDMEGGTPPVTLGRPIAVFICTFSADEPVDEVIRASTLLRSSTHIYVTGKPRITPGRARLLELAAGRVKLLGYLPDPDYKALIRSADFTIVITTRENTLVCGAYESFACEKPVILADTAALRAYFQAGSIFCKPEAGDIARAIDEMSANLSQLTTDASRQRGWMQRDWATRYEGLQREVSAHCDPNSDAPRSVRIDA